MNVLGRLLIFILFTDVTVGHTQATRYVDGCNNLAGANEFFTVDETVQVDYVLYNISNISGGKFFVNSPEGYIKVTSDGNYGLVKVGKQFDYELMPNHVYKYTLTCQYPYKLQVTIKNVVEDIPVFVKTTYNGRIKEDASLGTDIISTVEVNKRDALSSDIDIDKSNVPSVFRFKKLYEAGVDPPVKYSVLLNGNISYNTQPVYSFDVEVHVVSNPTLNSTAHFNITVEDVDDHSPKFGSTTYDISITEGTTAVSGLKTSPPLKAIDADKGLNVEINYKIIQAFPNKDWFGINHKNGEIIVNHPPDREECEYLTLFVKGYQIDKEEFRYSVAWVNVTILDIDDNDPVMDVTTYNVSIPENSPDKTSILQVHATDKDKGNNATFLYYFLSNKTGRSCNGMELDRSAGMISVGNSSMLDREIHSTLTCQVVARERNGKQSKVSTITVSLVDENDNNPIFNPDVYNYTIKKNMTLHSKVGQVIADDKDLSPEITYSLTDQTFQTFMINKKSGKITLTTSLEESFLNLYSFEVEASDGDKKAPRYTSVTVNIHVQDVNMHNPEFDPKQYNVTVLEDVAKGTHLIQLKAKDKDPDDKLTFSIIGNSSAYFDIDNTSGMLSLKNGLDYEVTTSHSIPVKVSDSVHSATTTITARVVDINDNPPKFDNTTYRFLNIEEEKINVTIGSVHATDADSGENKKFTYSIEAPWSSNFTINSDTGIITVNGKLDRETMEDSEIKFIVMATDQGHPSLTGTTEVIIEVTDVNDHCPYLNTQDQKFTYDFEELDMPKNFHKVEVQDIDRTLINRKMSYSFVGGHVGFEIDQGTGCISATNQLTIEKNNNGKIVLQIVVSNNPNCREKKTANQTVNINLQDVNRYTPQFKSSSYNFTLQENYTVGSQLKSPRIIATDSDTSAKYNTITYWINSGNDDGHFYMDQKTAEIYLIKPLDFESKTQYNLQVHATDGHPLYDDTYKNTSVDVLISVENVNDIKPQFSADQYTCTFIENQKTSAGCKISANDSEINTRLSYSLNDTSVFNISQTGSITVNSAGLDYDKGRHHYSLLVFAADGGRPELTGTAIVWINVKNVNDNSPKFPGNYSFTVMEDAPVSTIIGVIHATDNDGDGVTYSLTSSTTGFILDKTKGLLSVNSSLMDKEKYTLTIQATDGNRTATTTVIVTILDINNHAPEFVSPTYNASVTENKVNTSVITVKATDKDKSPQNKKISYSIDPTWSSNFSVSDTGIITVHGHLDREFMEDSEIKFVVFAKDEGHPSLTGTTEVFIEVTDVNDNCPYFNTQDHNFTYDFKELDKPTNFHKIEAQDMDKTSKNRKMSYSFVGGHVGFEIDQKTGYVSATDQLTMEKSNNGKIVLQIVVSNNPNCKEKETANQTVDINLQDVNRYTPQFKSSSYKITLQENFTVGNQLKGPRIIATDSDTSAKYNTITYWINSGNDDEHFYMDQKTAEIYLTKPLDFESKTQYNLQVHATDGHPLYDDTYKNTSVDVLISVENVNDIKPQFSADQYTCTFIENQKTSAGCKVSANDSEINTRLSYSLNDTSVFNISQTGSITVNFAGLDYDKGRHQYSLLVFAADGGRPELTGTATVWINVKNVNDNSPKYTGNYSFTVMEDAPLFTIIGVISATDDDGDTIKYSLTSSTRDFILDPNTGLLSVNSPLIDKTKYALRVQAKDGNHTSTTTVTVTILDINNHPPEFVSPSYSASVTENKVTASVITVKATDKDTSPQNRNISYSIDLPWSDNFTISQTGEITVKGSTDREMIHHENGQITLGVTATDNGNPSLTGTAEVIVEVIDVNDNCPYFNKEDKKFLYMFDELSVLHNFHTAVAYDKDRTDVNSQITYNLTKGRSYFSIQPNGNLSANQILKMDMTKNEKIDIEIRAYNNGPCGSFTADIVVQDITVVLKDVNNFSPKMEKGNITIIIPESFSTGAVINSRNRILAKDQDTSKEYNTVMYWIIGGNTDDTFHVDHYSGEIYLVKPLDYDDGPKSYILQISAIDCLNSTDGYCNHNDTAVVRVDITDANDNKPTFSTDLYHCKVLENSTGPLDNCQVKATDKDLGINGILTYMSLNKNFNVNSYGDLSVNSKLDYESGVKQYTVIIHAVDNGTTPLTGTATIIVTLLDTNDNPPTFITTPYNFNLEENEPTGTIVGAVSAADVDSDSTLTFNLQNHTSEFDIVNSGMLLSKKRFDYENDAKIYYIEVQVSDGNFTDATTVVVTIKNINDNQPVFLNKTYYIDVKEDIVSDSFSVINASDIDKLQPLSYSIVGNDGYCSDIFKIDDQTGKLYINNTNHCLDYDTSPVHTLLIQANDGNPTHDSRSLVQIDIKNIDNKPPRFYWSQYTGSVKENEANKFVTKVKAFDSDTKEIRLAYEVENFKDEFIFNGNTLMTKKELDAEYHSHYTVNISVSDGPRKDFATVDITVEDVNDNVPIFNNSIDFSVPANAKGNRFVGNILAYDRDISNKGFTYYLSEGDHFWIDNATGELFVMGGHGNHQFEANKTYEVIVNVIDHGQPPLISSEKIRIYIDITNHNSPIFQPVNVSQIPESAYIGTVVGKVTAYDSDPGNAGKVFYQLEPNVDYDGKFSINKTTGKISLIDKLDHEKVGHYELTVFAIDKADDPKTASTHVQIYVDDVNEKPQFLEKIDGICIKFPIAKYQTVAVVSARDPDKGDNLTYSLTDTTHFTIGRKSGEIKAKNSLNRSNFSITVIVKDKGGLNDTKKIDLYNNPSIVITPAVITVNITENSTDHYITQVNATSNSSLYYSIVNTTGFSINQHGLIKSDNVLDREIQDQQVINVRVNSSNSYCQVQVTVKILDINDNPPRFGFQYDMPTIPENYPDKTCFFYLPVEDPDLNTILTFDIIDDNSGGIFTIQKYTNETGGCLMLNTSLDYESIPENLHGVYSLMAEVNDGKYNSRREIKIHVTDVNDNYPYFNKTQYNTYVSENVPVQTSIIHLTAYDKDALDTGRLTYSLYGADSSFFIIENTSHFGDLKVNTNLDRETKSSYTVTVVVEDTDRHESNTSIYITVLDENDNAPNFTQTSYLYTLDEGPGSVGYQVQISTVDPDLGENGTNHFILSNTYSGLFNMTTLANNTGVITVLSALDRESPHVQKENGTAVFTLHIKAVDDGNPQKSAIEVVTLYVEDINDCVPQFRRSHYDATVLEGSPKGFSILSVSATDCDYNAAYNTITFSLVGTGSELFEIDNDGLITLNNTISVQSHKDQFNLTIVANDSKNTNTASLTVVITDVNDHDPVFTQQVYTFYTPETDEITAQDTVVGTVNATDEDLGNNGVITYSIISKDVVYLFNISQIGVITVIGQLDRDTCISSRYPFTVIAEDNGISRRTGYTEVIVYITDINDNSPVFTQSGYDGAVKENSPIDTQVNIVPPIHATDIDKGINGTEGIKYLFVGDNLPFRIYDDTGEVFVNSTHLDRETQPVYTLQVRAVDRNGTGRDETVNLTITLIDVNDVPPEFSTDNYTFHVKESALAGQKIGVVMTTDKDVNGNSTTRYRIASGSDGKFYVDILSGAIYTSGGLDREKKSKYVIKMEAFDGQQETNTTVYIYLEDVNDNCPVFQSQNLILRIPENTNISTAVYNLTAEDNDEGKNADISFYTNTSETTLFVVTGRQLILNGTLDREIQDYYEFKIFAEDHGIPSCHSNSTMQINVKDFNDNSPVFYNTDDKIISKFTATILEKSPVGSPIFFSDVRDNDIGENAEVRFSLLFIKPGISKYFTINPKTGVVSTRARIDLNSLNHLALLDQNATKTAALEMTVVAKDHGMPPLLTNLMLTVVVEGINDQAPVFLLPEYNFTMTENVPVGFFVGNVIAVVENGTYFKLKYSLITKSSSAEYFNVGQDSGNITTVTNIDREKTPLFNFAVQVTDGKTPERTAYTVVSVAVTDLNDNSPEFTQRSYKYITEENTIPQPLHVKATDADIGQNGHVTFFLLDNPGDHFILNQDTGILSVNGSLDREEAAMYNLTIQASDGGKTSLTDSVSVLVIVKDQNDNRPKFNTTHSRCTVRENQQPWTTVCEVKAYDIDSGLNGTVVYMFTGTHYTQFQIDPLDGRISTLVKLDYEEQSIYNLTVMSMDLGTPALNSTTRVTIAVLDEYDTQAHFTQKQYQITVDVDTQVSSVLLTVNAGQYHMNYTITGGNHGNHFSIGGSTGEITVGSKLGTSVLGYRLKVSATDGKSTDLTEVLVHVTTSNIQKQNNTFTAEIAENVNTTTLLIDLNYTDGSNVIFQYQLKQIIPDVKDTFELNQTTGEIYCIKKLDREDVDKYVFYVRAVTSSNRKKRSFGDSEGDIIVVVYVQDENDNPPVFNGGQQSLTIGILDTTNIGDLVTTLKAEDPDTSSSVKYSLSGGHDKDSFDVDGETGKVYSQVKVGSQKSYSVIVRATDGTLSSQVNISFLVMSSFDKLVLTIPVTTAEFEKKQAALLRNISSIVGFKIEMGKYEVHVDTSKHAVDLSRTDIYFHGINKTSGSIVPRKTAFRILHEKSKEIAHLFDVDHITVVQYHPTIVPHKMSESEIALLTIGVIILLSCLLALIAAKYTWKQFQYSQKTLQDKMWELNSLHSSHTNGTISMRQVDEGVVNPAFRETVFTTREDQVSATNIDGDVTLSRRREYESQEVILDLPFEPIDAALQQPVEGGAREMSLGYDSGLENESNSTSSAHEETRQESPEIRIETVVQGSCEEQDGTVFDKEQMAGSSHSQDIFIFDMETGDTDDGELEEDEMQGIKRRKSSKKKSNNDLKVFTLQSETGDTDDDDIDVNKFQKFVGRSKKSTTKKNEKHLNLETEKGARVSEPNQEVSDAVQQDSGVDKVQSEQDIPINQSNDTTETDDGNEVTSF